MKKLLFFVFIMYSGLFIFGQKIDFAASKSVKGYPQTTKTSFSKALDSVLIYNNNEILTRKTSYIFDGWGNVINKVEFSTNLSNQFLRTDSTVYKYQKDGNRIFLESFKYKSNNWVPYRKQIDTFENGINTLRYTYQWSTNTNDWTQYIVAYTYNYPNKNPSYHTKKLVNGVWKDYIDLYYEYDSHGNETMIKRQSYDLNTGDTIGNYFSEYTYDLSFDKKTSEIKYKWNSSTSDWGNNYRIDYTYNSNGQILSQIKKTWDGTNFINKSKYEYTYNTFGKETSFYDYDSWDPSAQKWIGYSKELKSYNSNDSLYSEEEWYWDENNENPGSDWIGDEKEIYTYSATEYTIENQVWDHTNNVFVYSTQTIAQFDQNGQDTAYIEKNWDKTSQAWVDTLKTVISYYSQNNEVHRYWQYHWNTANQQWDSYSVETFNYDGDYLTSDQIAKKNTNGIFLTVYSKSFSFDSYENTTKIEELDTTGKRHHVSEYTYDTSVPAGDIMFPDHKDAKSFYQYYDFNIYNASVKSMLTECKSVDTTVDDTLAKRVKFYYSQAPLSIKETRQIVQAKVYPNPSSDLIYFSFDPKFKNNYIEIFDIFGKLVKKQSVENRQAVSIGDLDAGIYLYRIRTNTGLILQGKISKQ